MARIRTFRRHELQGGTVVKAVIPGTEGYAEQATSLIEQYETVPFTDKHQPALHLIPAHPCNVLDIGAGTGADASWFANAGHKVVAVEPTREFRSAGMALHPVPTIEWVDDGLPHLEVILNRDQRFDLISLSAVWMHLALKEREIAMPNLARLLAHGGVVFMTLRHGPIPDGRRMFEVTAEETVLLAQSQGLKAVVNDRMQSAGRANRLAGVEWSHLAFARSS